MEFSARPEVKGLKRICEKMLEGFSELSAEAKAASQPAKESLIQHLPRLVCDIAGATCILDDAAGMQSVWQQLRSLEQEGLLVLREKSLMSPNEDSPSGYRDVKLFIECQGADAGGIIVELQLILRSVF